VRNLQRRVQGIDTGLPNMPQETNFAAVTAKNEEAGKMPFTCCFLTP